MPSDQLIDVRPIGVVETSVADDDVARQRRSMVYEICIFADFRVRLMGIEGVLTHYRFVLDALCRTFVKPSRLSSRRY